MSANSAWKILHVSTIKKNSANLWPFIYSFLVFMVLDDNIFFKKCYINNDF